MRFRHSILIGAVAGLLLAGFNDHALATNFTNGDFITYGQLDWADIPTAAALIQNNYNTLFASTDGDFEVGSPTGFVMVFDHATALAAYLPDVGPIGALDANVIDPVSTVAGAFSGDVTALTLNIDFSDAGLLPGNLGVRFGDLVLQNLPRNGIGQRSSLNGLTVRQFSTIVNTVLGGGSFGSFTIAELDPITSGLTTSFKGGVPDPGWTNNLAIAPVTLAIQSVSQSGGAITFTCSTTPASMYQIQCSTNLSQTNWISLGSAFRATNYTATVSDTITNAQMFYRIEQLP